MDWRRVALSGWLGCCTPLLYSPGGFSDPARSSLLGSCGPQVVLTSRLRLHLTSLLLGRYPSNGLNTRGCVGHVYCYTRQ